MFILSNLLTALAQGVDIFLTAMSWLIIIRALISWVSPDPYNPIVQFLNRVTDPILNPIRRLLPAMPIDISPIIAYVLISIVRTFLVRTLWDISYSIR
ncbi:MAG: YggT family protein [Candidatus Omnitrophica bacterium]|nr:YggT family protein [Candidatus Omnitrophota bacterium]